MNILVTGGCGFIGGALIRRLSKSKGNNILSIDNYSSSDGMNAVRASNVIYHRCDTSDIMCDIMCEKFNPDIVYHLGEYSRVFQSFEDIRLCHKSNSDGTFKVLEYCRAKNCKFVYGGSSSKFGNNGEDENLSPYAWLKAKNIELIKNYHSWWGLDYSIAYFYNVYGDGQISSGHMSTVIGIFQEQYKSGIPLSVVYPGDSCRDFTHIDDVIDGLILVGELGFGDGYMLGTGRSYSILDIANAFDHPINFIPTRRGERKDGRASPEQMFEEFHWEAKHDVIRYIKDWVIAQKKIV